MINILCAILLSMAVAEDDAIFKLFPGSGIPEGWVRSEETGLFVGQDLFGHINGGAEVYHEEGFIKLGLMDYSKGENEVRIEIYDMGSHEGGAGIFGINTEGLETSLEYGEASSVDELQIIFYRGRYYVSVTCYDVNDELAVALPKLAIATDEILKMQ